MIGEDEDDPEDDFNLINPRFIKEASTTGGTKKLNKIPSGVDKGNAEAKKIKMKYWKIDHYREQDRSKMDMLTKKL
jgi:hypothetical protein